MEKFYTIFQIIGQIKKIIDLIKDTTVASFMRASALAEIATQSIPIPLNDIILHS